MRSLLFGISLKPANADEVPPAAVLNGQGPLMMPGRMQSEYMDCTIFAVANATHLPYGVVATRAAEVLRDAEWRSGAERANPQKTIEGIGLNGGEVVMLAEIFGRAEVIPPGAFPEALKNGKTNTGRSRIPQPLPTVPNPSAGTKLC